MAEFTTTREQLNKNRDAYDKAKLDLFGMDQRLLILERERSTIERQKGDNNAVYQKLKTELDQKIEKSKRAQAAQRDKIKNIRDELRGAEVVFQTFVDPRRELERHFSNQIPFLLFPLRIETRFKTVDNKQQLWVRVFPDECLIDSFEPLLSRNEVNNAARFWAEYFSAGEIIDPANPDPIIVDQQKAAWRLLVSAHGDGRAAWITRQLTPDPTSVFQKGGDKTIILAIATDNWNPANQLVIVDLFSKLWFAYNNADQQNQIRSDFNNANPGLNADTIIAAYEPVNFHAKLPLGLKREDAELKVAIVIFKDLQQKIGKDHSWSQPTRVNLLPERLALILIKGNKAKDAIFGNPITYPLVTSPDPSAEAGKEIKQNDDEAELEFADSIKWVADFNRAVEIGMGFKVDLEPDETRGFTRLLVLGVNLSANEIQGKAKLEELFDHHFFSKKGFSILPQGMPTNNTGSSDSGYTDSDIPNQTFELYFKNTPGFKEMDDPLLRKDGQWLAEWLGIEYNHTKKLLNSGGSDQMDCRNMNTALWPGTLGYVMESLMEGGFPKEVIHHTREHFNNFVSGRGPIPAIRIGSQPYGILPTGVFHRLTWMNFNDHNADFFRLGRRLSYLKDLYDLLLKMENYWNANLVGSVPHISQNSNQPYQKLLDIIGLHPNSVEFHRRYMESLISMNNAMSYAKPGLKNNQGVVTPTMNLLQQTLGYESSIIPQLAALLGLSWEYPVKFLIDDLPLSESDPIRGYTADKRNYIAALVDQARKSENALRTGEGLTERPLAELYRLLKYSLEQEYHNSALDAAAESNAIPSDQLIAKKIAKPFIHQLWKQEITESQYAFLYHPLVPLSPAKTPAEIVCDALKEAVVPSFAHYLSTQLTAMEQLKNASTSRLERALVEHIDCLSYRLDAWKMSLFTNALMLMRKNSASIGNNQRQTGIYLGAFGWLENVRPEKNKVMKQVEIPGNLVEDFNPKGTKIFHTDSANEGYIHAPSLNQAITAAVLRNGFISHGKPDANNVLAVNLSSDRIRLALSIIEGIQGGQSLAALLGYHFERELHDREDLKEKKIDSYIYRLRKLFPLKADKLEETKVTNTADPSIDPDTVPITSIEARNVVHGVNLSNHVKNQTSAVHKIYPFNLDLPDTEQVIKDAVTAAINQIIDIADAIADLGVAESVHSIVMGNYDRAAGVLDTYTKGNYPQIPDVIITPRNGPTLTHRVGIPLQYVELDAGTGPRAQTEPSINQWLTTILPGMNNIICNCSYLQRSNGASKDIEISLSDIGMKPIDLLYIQNTLDARASDELDDRFVQRIHATKDPLIDGVIKINYTKDSADPNKFSLFQVMPLVKSLRFLLLESVALNPGDVTLPNEANKKDIPMAELASKRVENLKDLLKTFLAGAKQAGQIVGYLSGLPKQEDATEADLNDMRQKVDNTISRFTEFLLELGKYGISQTGTGSVYLQRQQWFISLKNKVKEFRDRWEKNAEDFETLKTNPPSPENLQAMERLISTQLTPLDTITDVGINNKRVLFGSALNQLKDILNTNQPTLLQLIQQIQAFDTSPFDLLSLDLKDELKQIPLFVYDLKARVQSLVDELEKIRIVKAEKILTDLGMIPSSDQAKQVEAAARLILGDSFRMIPRYTLTASQQSEISNSWNAKDTLLNYLKTTAGHIDPAGDWLHGIARVHDKMKHLENCILLRQAFGLSENDFTIHPVQLPFASQKYHWLAMSYPENDVDLEKTNFLLYAAFTSKTATSPTEICGILLDEWTEVIPAKEETTGISFHYDRPNCEAPQVLLLVTPSKLDGNWQWSDLVESLQYTIDAARSRAVQPKDIDKTTFGSLLPAVLAAESLFPFSIVLDNKAHYMTPEAIRKFD